MIKLIQKRLLFVSFIILMLMPFAEYHLKLFNPKPLDGAFETLDKPELKWFTWKSWFNEKFQNDFNKSLEANIAYRNYLIRLNNQLDYTFFKQTSTNKAIIGKSDCLYEEGYILDYIGANFLGKDSIDNLLQKTKKLQLFLKKHKNIDLIIVFEPGKASFFPEYIPDKYKVEKKTISNYKYFSEQSKLLKINNLDLNAWFMKMKNKSEYPLFPKYGVHWSTYGMCLAADTLIKFIENTRNIDLPEMYWYKINVTDKLKDVDFDIELTLNLLCELPHEKMAYPEIRFKNSGTKYKPNVLTIADSYYWSIFNNKIPDNVFNNHQFWYYNTTIYPDIWGENAKYVDHTKDKENIEKQDVILIMVTELNLYKSFFGFVDKVYKLYELR